MPPGPPQLQDDEGGGIGAVHGPVHLGERPTLHCEALGGVMQKSFSILKIHFINVSRTTATGPLLEKKWSHSQRINGVDFLGGAIMSS